MPAAGDERAHLRLDPARRRQLPDLLGQLDDDEDAGLWARLYRRLSAELEGGIGYHGTGSIRLAHHRERMDEFRHVRAMAQAQGLAYDLLGPPRPASSTRSWSRTTSKACSGTRSTATSTRRS